MFLTIGKPLHSSPIQCSCFSSHLRSAARTHSMSDVSSHFAVNALHVLIEPSYISLLVNYCFSLAVSVNDASHNHAIPA